MHIIINANGVMTAAIGIMFGAITLKRAIECADDRDLMSLLWYLAFSAFFAYAVVRSMVTMLAAIAWIAVAILR